MNTLNTFRLVVHTKLSLGGEENPLQLFGDRLSVFTMAYTLSQGAYAEKVQVFDLGGAEQSLNKGLSGLTGFCY